VGDGGDGLKEEGGEGGDERREGGGHTAQAAALTVPMPKRGGKRSSRAPVSSAYTSSPSVPILGLTSFLGLGLWGPNPQVTATWRTTYSKECRSAAARHGASGSCPCFLRRC